MIKLSVSEMLVIGALEKAYDTDFENCFQHPLLNKKYAAKVYDLITTDHKIIIPNEIIEHSLQEKEKAWKDTLVEYSYQRKRRINKKEYNKNEAVEYYKADLLCRFMKKLKEKGWNFKVIVDKERKKDILIDFYHD